MPRIYMQGDKVIFDGEGAMADMIGEIDRGCTKIEIANWVFRTIEPTPLIDQNLSFTILPEEPPKDL